MNERLKEIIVRVVDKNPNAADAARRGHVLDVKPYGYSWTDRERTNDEWRIIRAPIYGTHAAVLLAIGSSTFKKAYLDFSVLADPSLYSGARSFPIIDETAEAMEAATKEHP